MRTSIVLGLVLLPAVAMATAAIDAILTGHASFSNNKLSETNMRRFREFLANPWALSIHKNKNCVTNSRIVKGECTCRKGFEGNGYFFCYRSTHWHTCRIVDDLSMGTLGGQGVRVHPVGATKLAQSCTKRKLLGYVSGTCDVTVFGWTERVVGKVYIGGIQIELNQTNTFGKTNRIIFRISSESRPDGSYCWNVTTFYDELYGFSRSKLYCVKNPASRRVLCQIPRAGCFIIFKIAKQHFFYATIKCCGVQIGFRQFHLEYPLAVPGFYYLIHKKHHIAGKQLDMKLLPLCLIPETNDLNLKDVVEYTGFPDAQLAMTFVSITNIDFSCTPWIPAGQETLANLMCEECSLKERFIMGTDLGFIVYTPPLTFCISNHSQGLEEVIKLYTLVVRWYCMNDVRACEQVKSILQDRCPLLVRSNVHLQLLMSVKCTPNPIRYRIYDYSDEFYQSLAES